MARCREVLISSVTGRELLVCDRDDCHDPLLLDFHYDKLQETEWRQREVPALVPSNVVVPLNDVSVSAPLPVLGTVESLYYIFKQYERTA